MKLLIITQKIDRNDDILGFFHQWIIEFSKKCEKVTAICLQKREHDLPDNVKILSLGKENKQSKIKYLFNFYKYIWQERNNYDKVFVHMNPEYVVLGGLFWELWRKDVFLWYTHKSVNLWLRLAENLVNKIFTASKESFRLKSEKVVVTGHGIDVGRFKQEARDLPRGKAGKKQDTKKFTIVTAGRITKSKNLDILIDAAEILKDRNFSAKGGPASGWDIKIAGSPVLEEDKIYFEKLKEIVKEKKLEDKIIFVGATPNKDIHEFYQKGELFVNLSSTGSLDKAVLEAMASGLMVLTSNEAFKEILPSKYFASNDARDIAERIILLSKEGLNPELRKYVVENHNLQTLIEKIVREIK